MSQDGYPISVTLKGGSDYSAPWIVLYGHRPEEVQEKLQAVIDGELAAKAAEAAAFFRAQHSLAAGGASAGSPPAQQQAQPVQQQAPAQRPQTQFGGGQQQGDAVRFHPEGIECESCGEPVIFKEITAKATGKRFKLWTCPNQRRKDDGHYSQFAN